MPTKTEIILQHYSNGITDRRELMRLSGVANAGVVGNVIREYRRREQEGGRAVVVPLQSEAQ